MWHVRYRPDGFKNFDGQTSGEQLLIFVHRASCVKQTTENGLMRKPKRIGAVWQEGVCVAHAEYSVANIHVEGMDCNETE